MNYFELKVGGTGGHCVKKWRLFLYNIMLLFLQFATLVILVPSAVTPMVTPEPYGPLTPHLYARGPQFQIFILDNQLSPCFWVVSSLSPTVGPLTSVMPMLVALTF